MKAAIVYNKGDLRIEEVKIPDVPKGSVRIKVRSCAICGTDVRIYRKGDYRAAYPVIVGHEIAAVVDAVAPGVKTIKEGERVCVAPGHGCGACPMCRNGRPNVCTRPFPSLGYKVNGGLAEYMAVPENIFRLGFVNPIPENLSFEDASLSEIIACCLNAQNNSPVQEGDRVLIMGCGPAGIIHAHLARLKGAAKVMVAQRSRPRLEMARTKFPGVIDRVIASREEDLTKAILDETGGEGADVIYVCAPSRKAQEEACELVAPRGRINFFGGLPKNNCCVQINANNLHYKEFFIAGASSSLPEGNREALCILSERLIDPSLLITHRFELDEIHRAFEVAEGRAGIKIVVNCSH